MLRKEQVPFHSRSTMKNSRMYLAATLLATAVLLASLVACANPADSDSSDDSDNPAATDSASAPTLAALTGTWVLTETWENKDYETDALESTEVRTTTRTIATDGSFIDEVISVETPVTGTATTSYSSKKGTLAVVGDKLAKTITHTRYSSTEAFTGADTGWNAESPAIVETTQAIIVSGKLYEDVFKAQGSVSGIQGTWVMEQYDSEDTKPYRKVVIQFNSDGTVSQAYFTSATESFADTSDGSYLMNYVANQNGSITLTMDGQVESMTAFYKIFDSYLILGGESYDSDAFVKQ